MRESLSGPLRVALVLLSLVILVAGAWVEVFGIYYAFTRVGHGTGVLAVVVPPVAWYYGIMGSLRHWREPEETGLSSGPVERPRTQRATDASEVKDASDWRLAVRRAQAAADEIAGEGFTEAQRSALRKGAQAASKAWWQTDYQALIRRVAAPPARELATSWRTGPGGKAEVRVRLARRTGGGLVMKLALPPEGTLLVDPQTGTVTRDSQQLSMTIRDHDEDGVPDDFRIAAAGAPLPGESFTQDGFVRFRPGEDHQGVWFEWSVAVGFCVNHFIYGIDSAMPRR